MTHQSEFGVRAGSSSPPRGRLTATRWLLLGLGVAVLLAAFAPTAWGSGATTTFERTWGKDVGGSGVGLCTVVTSCLQGAQGGLGGEFWSPSALATDADGNVYVADTFNARVQKFDAAGTFLLAWGKDVGGSGVGICTIAANCHPGAAGGKGGEFAAGGPDGVATDAAGNVYVVEHDAQRVQKFTSAGVFVRAWGKNVGGPSTLVCTDASVCQAGSSGSLGGQFFYPQGIATDTAGNVYVTEAANARIQKFDSDGVFLRAWGKNVGGSNVPICTVAANCHQGNFAGAGGEFSSAFGIAVGPSGTVYVSDASLYRVQSFDSSGAFLKAWGKGVGGVGIDTCTDAPNCVPGTSGVEGGQFNANGAAGVATDAAGDVYVANAAAGGRVQQFDSVGNFLQMWGKDVGGVGVGVCTVAATCQLGTEGAFGGEFRQPSGVATSPGAVYVADYENKRIQRFAASAPATLRTLTVTVTGSGTVTGPGITCGAGGTDCSETVADGTTIALTATPAAGASFAGFTGGGCGAASPCTVTMTADRAVAAAFAAAPPGFAALPSAAGCTIGRLILTDVFPLAGRTKVLGVAPAAARGKRVTIVSTWNGKAVANVTVAADLSFTASLPLPPAALRGTNAARYLARLGATKSAALKFSRRMYTTAITAAGATLTFRGVVTRPLTAPPSRVTIRAAASCATVPRGVVVATVSTTRAGAFTATFTLPAALQGRAVYLRAQTTVRRTTRSRTTSPTFTLVRGITPLAG